MTGDRKPMRPSPKRDSVIDPALPKAEQEKRVEDEIEKSDAELFGDRAPQGDRRPRSG